MKRLRLAHGYLLIICLLLLILNPSCYRGVQQIDLSGDPDEVEKELLKLIPLGSPISDAEGIIKNNGFQCKYALNKPYSKLRNPVKGSIQGRAIRYKPTDILSCEKTQHFVIVYTKSHIIFASKRQLVTDVAFWSDSVGP